MDILQFFAATPLAILPAIFLGKYKMHINLKIRFAAIILLIIQVAAVIIYTCLDKN